MERKLGWCTLNFHCRLTKVLRDSYVPHSCFTVLEFWVREFQLPSIVRVPCSHISMQIKVEMHCSKNMPAGEDIAMLQFTLSWCMTRGNGLHKKIVSTMSSYVLPPTNINKIHSYLLQRYWLGKESIIIPAVHSNIGKGNHFWSKMI